MGPPRPCLRAAVAAIAVGLALVLVGCGSDASGGAMPPSTRPTTVTTRPATTTTARATTTTQRGTIGLETVAVSALPPEARDTLALIDAGGPFPHAQDGQVFQNREQLLPRKPGGYYHEYTVETPGSADRGARRIVTGGAGEQLYTDDHYASFREIVPG